MTVKEVFIPKRANTRLRVCVNEYEGKVYVDYRKYFEDADTLEWWPTRKGCTVPLGLWETFKTEIAKIEVPESEEQVEAADT